MNKEKELPELLRLYLVEHASLPVRGGNFNIDNLIGEGPCMSLVFTDGGWEKTWIDGARVVEQMFFLRYRVPITDDNDETSTTMGALNQIGAWMDEMMRASPPDLGDWISVNKFELISRARQAERTEKFITYQAGYALGYETI